MVKNPYMKQYSPPIRIGILTMARTEDRALTRGPTFHFYVNVEGCLPWY